ncbi:MAG: dTDP-4-dehydrorhamnose 3,5-epimerase [Planctomycetota bacterium]|jgi:dTDP-4-dehydrorhamnose 3,5-epimerase|nr:dTDP-4-dehydrorhamnose 3,5-epimerase [Planctomycetota bacterium]
MERVELAIPDLLLLQPDVFGDKRGFFFETYRRNEFADFGITADFIQDNHSGSIKNVLRGLHYQLARSQAKLVRVVRGEVYDVAADIRRDSPWFGKYCGVILSGTNRRVLYIPEGFAHGFFVLSDTAEFAYKCSDYYSPNDERGILWNDPGLGIEWPVPPGVQPILSSKDAAYGTLAETDAADLPVYGAGKRWPQRIDPCES